MSFVPVATGIVVVSACVLNAVAVLLTLEELDQRTQNGKIGVLLVVLGVTLLLGFDFALYPLLIVSQAVSGGTAGLLTLLWIAFLPLSLVLIGIGANLRRTGIFLKRRKR